MTTSEWLPCALFDTKQASTAPHSEPSFASLPVAAHKENRHITRANATRAQRADLLGRPRDEVLDEEVDLLHDEELLHADDSHPSMEQEHLVRVPAHAHGHRRVQTVSCTGEQHA